MTKATAAARQRDPDETALLGDPPPKQHRQRLRPAPAEAIPCVSAADLSVLLGKQITTRNEVASDVNVVYAPARLPSPHMLVVGMTGAGKTHRLRTLGNSIAMAADARVIVVDVSGDIRLDGEVRVKFSESSPYGLNPLAVHPGTFGDSIEQRIKRLTEIMATKDSRVSPKLTEALRRIALGLYEAQGYDIYDEAWRRQTGLTPPTMDQLVDAIDAERTRLGYLLNSETMQAIETFRRRILALSASHRRGAEPPKLETERQAIHQALENYLQLFDGKRQLGELVTYEPKDTMDQLFARVASIARTGIFKPSEPPFGEARVRVYDLSRTGRDDQILFLETLLADEMRRMKLALLDGETEEDQIPAAQFPTTFFIIDEAERFFTERRGSALEGALREIRKYGGAMILASQSTADFAKPVIGSTGTRIILGLDTTEAKMTASKLLIDKDLIRTVRPQLTALVQFTRTASVTETVMVALPRAAARIASLATDEPDIVPLEDLLEDSETTSAPAQT